MKPTHVIQERSSDSWLNRAVAFSLRDADKRLARLRKATPQARLRIVVA